MANSTDDGARKEREARRRTLDAILARIDKLPRNDGPSDLEWDENGLPI